VVLILFMDRSKENHGIYYKFFFVSFSSGRKGLVRPVAVTQKCSGVYDP